VVRGPDYAYAFYTKRFPSVMRFEDMAHWGCFAYDYLPHKGAIHIHFGVPADIRAGPLRAINQPQRRRDLQAMFTHIRQHAFDAREVHGASWLYNRSEYCRLFPEVYIASALPVEPHYRARALWGQFLRSTGAINEDVVAVFLQRVERMRASVELRQCFPYQVLETRAPIAAFYAWCDVASDMQTNGED
jgi:hypothetical protein